MRKLGIGLIGSGFMGRAHALAFRTVGGVFDLAAVPELEMLADIDAEAAARSAASLGFNDLKVIGVKTLIDAITGNGSPFPDFREAYEVERVVDAVRLSSAESRWVGLS